MPDVVIGEPATLKAVAAVMVIPTLVTLPNGVVASVPSPLIYCAVVPPGANKCECVPTPTEFVEASVIELGVPNVTAPDVVIVVNVIPLPALTEVTVPDVKVGKAIIDPSPAT